MIGSNQIQSFKLQQNLYLQQAIVSQLPRVQTLWTSIKTRNCFLSGTKHPFYWLDIQRHWDIPCHQSLCLDLHLILWPTVWPLVTLYNAIIDVSFGGEIDNRRSCRMRLPVSCANASLQIRPPLSCAVKDCLRMLLLSFNTTPVRVFFEPFWSQVNITAGIIFLCFSSLIWKP